MVDLIERLRMWPAADGKDGLNGTFVEALMQEAAAEIERLRTAIKDCADGGPCAKCELRDASEQDGHQTQKGGTL